MTLPYAKTETARKITVRDLGNPKNVKRKDAEGSFVHPGRMSLGYIWGIVEKMQSAVSPSGDDLTLFRGTFRALVTESKTLIEAASLILPSNLADTIAALAEDDTGATYPVELAFEFGTQRTTGPIGWQWAIAQVTPAARVLPIGRLTDMVAEHVAAHSAVPEPVPAPAPSPTPEPAPAPSPAPIHAQVKPPKK